MLYWCMYGNIKCGTCDLVFIVICPVNACLNPTVSSWCKWFAFWQSTLSKLFKSIKIKNSNCNGLVSHPGRVKVMTCLLIWIPKNGYKFQCLWVIMTIIKPHSMIYFHISFLMVWLKSLVLYCWFQVEGKMFTQEQNLVLTAVLKLKTWKVWNCKN